MSRWPYLHTEPFLTRHAIAAWLLRGSRTVVEIGAESLDLVRFLGPPVETFVAIGPGLPPNAREEDPAASRSEVEVVALAAGFESVDQRRLPRKRYGVALLGMCLEMPDEGWGKLLRFLGGAERVVIEIPVDNPPSVRQIESLEQRLARRGYTFDVDLRAVPDPDPRVARFGLRRFHVLENGDG